jgi:hypothetical protein
MALTTSQENIVDSLLQEQKFPKWYRSYTWKDDTWKTGFPDLFRLEQRISRAARERAIGEQHLLEIAEWGGLRNKKRISCPKCIKIRLYGKDAPAGWLKKEPEKAVWLLENQILGFGPSYSSKILHFAVPQVFGAIDTRLVRIFGQGDEAAQRYPLLDLKVTKTGSGWAIFSNQNGWPDEFGTWTKHRKDPEPGRGQMPAPEAVCPGRAPREGRLAARRRRNGPFQLCIVRTRKTGSYLNLFSIFQGGIPSGGPSGLPPDWPR